MMVRSGPANILTLLFLLAHPEARLPAISWRKKRVARRRLRAAQSHGDDLVSYVDSAWRYAVHAVGARRPRYEPSLQDLWPTVPSDMYICPKHGRPAKRSKLQRRFAKRTTLLGEECGYRRPEPGTGPMMFNQAQLVGSLFINTVGANPFNDEVERVSSQIWGNREFLRCENEVLQVPREEYEPSRDEIGWAVYYGEEERVLNVVDAGTIPAWLFGEDPPEPVSVPAREFRPLPMDYS